jgi:hypothetical protein
MFTSKTEFLAPFLKIYKRMKIIIMENLYPKLGIYIFNMNTLKIYLSQIWNGYKKML